MREAKGLRLYKFIDAVSLNGNGSDVIIKYKNDALFALPWDRGLHRWEFNNNEIPEHELTKSKDDRFGVCVVDEVDDV